MCTIEIEALTSLDRTPRIKMFKKKLDPGSFLEELKGLFISSCALNESTTYCDQISNGHYFSAMSYGLSCRGNVFCCYSFLPGTRG